MKKRLLSLITVLTMLMSFVSIIATAATSGTCGDNLIWTLDDGTLTISGTGDMRSFYDASSMPWYSSKEDIKKVNISTGVTSIGSYAFNDCDSLTSIIIPDSVTIIGYSAFEDCDSLTNIEIPNSVISIGDDAFFKCGSLTSIIIPNSVTSIGYSTFSNCSSLTSIEIPNSVTSIGHSAFSGCSSLTSIEIPNNVTSIGDNAFAWCSRLSSIIIPSNVRRIDNFAFHACDSITDIYYSGSESDWNKIAIESSCGYYFEKATIHFNSGRISDNAQSTPSSWAKSDIEKATELNLIPEDLQSEWQTPITRLDFCRLAQQLFVATKGAGNLISVPQGFKDISDLSSNDQFTVNAMANLGIVSGYEDKTFRPYNTITREEAASLLARTAKTLGKDSTNKYPVIFEDFYDISSWAKSDVDFISAIGVMSGVQVDDYTLEFQPKETYTREQAMVTFYRLYKELQPKTLEEKFPDEENLYTTAYIPEFEVDGYNVNFYNFSGMYIDNFKGYKNGDSCHVTFDVYNTAYINGIVEVYDKDDNLKNAAPIHKMADNATSIVGSLWDNSVDLMNDIIKGQLLTYRQESGYSVCTPIEVDIPYGGYIKITNSATESPLLAVLNIADMGLATASLCGDVEGFSKKTNKNFTEKVTKEILKDEILVNLIKDKDSFNKSILKGIGQDVTLSSKTAGDYVSTLVNNLNNLGFEEIVATSALSVGVSGLENAFIAMSGPAGAAMEGLFIGTKAGNLILETKHYFDTLYDTDKIMIQYLGEIDNEISMGGR